MTAGLVFKSDELQDSQVSTIELLLVVTGAKGLRQLKTTNAKLITGFDAGDFVQADIDALVGASQIDAATAFGSTAMGTNAVGFVLDTKGQVAKVLAVEALVVSTAGGTPATSHLLIESTESALPNTLTSGIEKTANGDLYGRVVASNVDAATAGYIHLRIFFRAK